MCDSFDRIGLSSIVSRGMGGGGCNGEKKWVALDVTLPQREDARQCALTTFAVAVDIYNIWLSEAER